MRDWKKKPAESFNKKPFNLVKIIKKKMNNCRWILIKRLLMNNFST